MRGELFFWQQKGVFGPLHGCVMIHSALETGQSPTQNGNIMEEVHAS